MEKLEIMTAVNKMSRLISQVFYDAFLREIVDLLASDSALGSKVGFQPASHRLSPCLSNAEAGGGVAN